ncbi:MAG TPA: transcription termination factor NusA [Candidatus Treponema faecavium]|nr:transcription termination factor NusA [Candidatus Treponema faecavium]
MASQIAEAIRQLTQDKGIPEESVVHIIEDMIKAAYKRSFGTDENVIIKFNDDLSDVSVYARKVIVDGVYDPTLEMELEEAQQLYSPDCEVGDEIDILIDPKSFARSAVQTGKQRAHQSLSEIQKDSLYAEYKDKIGDVIVGYYQRERNGNIYVDLGKIEGYLPVKYQSPREVYHKNDRIKVYVKDIKKTNSGLQLIVSRTDPDFVRAIVELEVPEIYDKTVDIYKVVREPGYRTKIAVLSHRDDVDPVGACVGLKGVRIQAIIRELEGEKIDILKYEPDPKLFIKNALSPAEVLDVVIIDEDKKQAVAVVADDQLSLAIGKQGLNVRLANRLCDWSIDVKTEKQFEEFDAEMIGSRKAAHDLFSGGEEITLLSEVPGIDEHTAAVLREQGIEEIGQFIEAFDNGSISACAELSEEDIERIHKILTETVDVIEDVPDSETAGTSGSVSDEAAGEDEDVYECPNCGAPVTIDMTECPNCGVGIEFEDEE